MPTIDFFDREVRSAQDRFNETFGRLVVCNIRTRQLVILSIVRMGLLARKINTEYQDQERRDKIRTFMQIKTRLQDYFNATEAALPNPKSEDRQREAANQ